ncbi:hypothetical protein EMIT019CA3_80081 [Bacillus pseudomycoides]
MIKGKLYPISMIMLMLYLRAMKMKVQNFHSNVRRVILKNISVLLFKMKKTLILFEISSYTKNSVNEIERTEG